MQLTALCNLEHRGASGADPETGDGAGILIQIPHDFFISEAKKTDIDIVEDNYGTGIIFCGNTQSQKDKIKEIFESCAKHYNLDVLWWRNIPTAPDKIGKTAREIMPLFQQVFVGNKNGDQINNINGNDFLIPIESHSSHCSIRSMNLC